MPFDDDIARARQRHADQDAAQRFADEWIERARRELQHLIDEFIAECQARSVRPVPLAKVTWKDSLFGGQKRSVTLLQEGAWILFRLEVDWGAITTAGRYVTGHPIDGVGSADTFSYGHPVDVLSLFERHVRGMTAERARRELDEIIGTLREGMAERLIGGAPLENHRAPG